MVTSTMEPTRPTGISHGGSLVSSAMVATASKPRNAKYTTTEVENRPRTPNGRKLRYSAIDPDAPFSSAFRAVAGWHWAQYVVALGELKGMTTVLLVGTISQARYVTHIARTHMLPPWFAHIDVRTCTPVRATVVGLLATSAVALFTSLHVLANLLSISTLAIFMLVAVALLVRRHYVAGGATAPKHVRLLTILVLAIVGSSVGSALCWGLGVGWQCQVIFGAIWFSATWSMWYFVPIVRTPKVWGAPFIPWLPAASIGINIFLLGSIDRASFIRFRAWTAVILIYYALVGLHASYDAAAAHGSNLGPPGEPADSLKPAVPTALQDGTAA